MALIMLLFTVFSFPCFSVVLTENEAVRLYIERNLEEKAARYEISLVEAEELTAGLWANPSIFIDTQLNPVGGYWDRKNIGGPVQQDYFLTVPVDINGKRRQALRVARLATKVKEAEFQAKIREGIFTMLCTLYNVQKLKLEHDLLQEKSDLLDKLLKNLNKNFKSASRRALIKSRAELANLEVKLDMEKNKMARIDQLNQLRIFFDLSSEDMIEPSLTFKNYVDESIDKKRLLEEGKKNRPDFHAIRILKEQYEQQAILDRRKIFDDVNFQGGFSNQNPAGEFNGAWSWMIGVTIPIPVFDRKQGQIMKTKILSNQAQVKEQFMKETLAREIDISAQKIEMISKNLSQYKSGLIDNARVMRDSTIRQFGTGASSLVELLDALNSFHSTIQRYIDAEYELTTENLKLKLLTGQEIRS